MTLSARGGAGQYPCRPQQGGAATRMNDSSSQAAVFALLADPATHGTTHDATLGGAPHDATLGGAPHNATHDATHDATLGGAVVKRIDTHAASVFLAGNRAFKV